MHTAKLMLLMIKYRIKVTVQYRWSFFIGIVAQWLGNGAELATLYVAVSSFENLNGWNAYEVLLLYGMSLLSYAIGSSFAFDVVRYMPRIASEGGLDELLTRPVHPLASLVGSNFNVGYLSHFTLSVGVVVFALVRLGVPMGVGRVIWLIVCILGASMLHCAAQLALSFYSMRHLGQSPLRSLYGTLRDYTNYPLSAFCKNSILMQLIFTVLLPFGFVAFYPSQYFLGKSDFMMFSPVIQYLTPAVGFAAMILTIVYFNYIIKAYRSSGT